MSEQVGSTMKTPERILAAALRLFNEAGTAAVSTNHIAEALGISPGNLYYHFRNKEEIIRALFEQQFARADQLYALPRDHPPTLADLRELVRATFMMSWDYRFIYRELIALLRRDDQLRRRWVEVRARGFAGFHELVDLFVAAGVLAAPSDSAAVTRLAELCWLISEFWLASVEVSGLIVDDVQVERGVALLLQVLEPYIVPELK
ncbi:MAG TPA: TetR/AcrR family transcriptional regulator [Roseiflexaceae bacterium]|nr:TetR/AcrR family transcriptional regulator [Roseiflexaceae bacterium]